MQLAAAGPDERADTRLSLRLLCLTCPHRPRPLLARPLAKTALFAPRQFSLIARRFAKSRSPALSRARVGKIFLI